MARCTFLLDFRVGFSLSQRSCCLKSLGITGLSVTDLPGWGPCLTGVTLLVGTPHLRGQVCQHHHSIPVAERAGRSVSALGAAALFSPSAGLGPGRGKRTKLEAERVQTLIGIESSQGCPLGTHMPDLFWEKPVVMGQGTYRRGHPPAPFPPTQGSSDWWASGRLTLALGSLVYTTRSYFGSR